MKTRKFLLAALPALLFLVYLTALLWPYETPRVLWRNEMALYPEKSSLELIEGRDAKKEHLLSSLDREEPAPHLAEEWSSIFNDDLEIMNAPLSTQGLRRGLMLAKEDLVWLNELKRRFASLDWNAADHIARAFRPQDAPFGKAVVSTYRICLKSLAFAEEIDKRGLKGLFINPSLSRCALNQFFLDLIRFTDDSNASEPFLHSGVLLRLVNPGGMKEVKNLTDIYGPEDIRASKRLIEDIVRLQNDQVILNRP